jgi:glycosyltransferase involved in cell wall biosynthesis
MSSNTPSVAVERVPPARPDRQLVSVVAPVYNEAATLPSFLGRLVAAAKALEDRFSFEFVLVDDGSTDDSLELAKRLLKSEPRLRVIQLRRNFGQTAALQAGFNAALGDVIVSMDSDLQHFPEDLPLLLDKLEQGFDLVCGWRRNRDEGADRRWPSRVANALIRRVTGLPIHDFGTTFRAYRSDLVRHLRLLGEQHRFVPALAHMVGARVAEVPIQNARRSAGVSHYGLGRTLNVILDIVYLYFTKRYLTRPLQAFGRLALVSFAIGASIFSFLIIYAYATGIATVRERSGWFLLSLLLMLAALQLMLGGILAEIIVRIYYGITGNHGFVIRREWTAYVRHDRASTTAAGFTEPTETAFLVQGSADHRGASRGQP